MNKRILKRQMNEIIKSKPKAKGYDSFVLNIDYKEVLKAAKNYKGFKLFYLKSCPKESIYLLDDEGLKKLMYFG